MFVNCITTSEHNENTNKMAISWLDDTSAQCHIFTKSEKRSTLSKSSVKMGNNSTSDGYVVKTSPLLTYWEVKFV